MNLFKKAKQAIAVAMEEPPQAVVGKTPQQIIQEIHDTFDTEVDRLLEAAQVSKSKSSQKEDLIKKADLLMKHGFGQAREVIAGFKQLTDLKVAEQTIEAIEYFSKNYPNYKFITENSVKRICEKYGLIYGKVRYYTGEVPDKNLKHIDDFKIRPEDKCYFNYESLISLEEFTSIKSESIAVSWRAMPALSVSGFEIVAPKSDFDTRNMIVSGSKLVEIPDPIVLHPVQFKKEKYYLVVTAWGLEATDPLVVNERNN